MKAALHVQVTESLSELRKELRNAGNDLLRKRIRFLIVIRQHEGELLSKRRLSELTGYNANSTQKWRKMYLEGGLCNLLKHSKTGYKPSIISGESKDILSEVLHNPSNGINGYKELQRWVKDNLEIDVKYTTLNEFVKRHFGAKVKVARKSHIHKNPAEVEDFKKNSESE